MFLKRNAVFEENINPNIIFLFLPLLTCPFMWRTTYFKVDRSGRKDEDSGDFGHHWGSLEEKAL